MWVKHVESGLINTDHLVEIHTVFKYGEYVVTGYDIFDREYTLVDGLETVEQANEHLEKYYTEWEKVAEE